MATLRENDMPDATCILDGCDKKSRNPNTPSMCPMHYHRQYRHGSTEMVATGTDVSASLGRRYRRVYVPVGHPLRGKSEHQYEHRMVLYDTLGAGPHACHWCGTDVDWVKRGDPRSLEVDHLNGDGGDNRPENLVASCRRCNTGRANQRRGQALREAGWWSEHDTVERLKNQRRLPPIVAKVF